MASVGAVAESCYGGLSAGFCLSSDLLKMAQACGSIMGLFLCVVQKLWYVLIGFDLFVFFGSLVGVFSSF